MRPFEEGSGAAGRVCRGDVVWGWGSVECGCCRVGCGWGVGVCDTPGVGAGVAGGLGSP